MNSKVGEFSVKSLLQKAIGAPKSEAAPASPPAVSLGNVTKISDSSSNRESEDAVRITLGERRDPDSRSVDVREFARQRGKATEVGLRGREIEGSEAPGQGSGRTLSGTYGGGKFKFNGSDLGGEYFRRDDGRLGFTIGEDKRFEGIVQDGVAYIKDTKTGKYYAGELKVGNGEFTLSNIQEIEPPAVDKQEEASDPQ